MTNMKSDLVDIMVELHHQTEKAWLVSTTGQGDDAKWIPKSAGELEKEPNGLFTLTIPERLAIDKELV